MDERPFQMERFESALDTCCKQLGISLRPTQIQALRSLVIGNDVFVSLPTGSGKTLCYAALPQLFDCYNGTTGSIVVVISPLLSLMKDQVQLLNSIGITAAYIGSDQDNESIVEGVKNGSFQIVLFTPESIVGGSEWRDLMISPLYQENLVCLAVDEAHCIVKWGTNFRKEFSNIVELRSLIPEGTPLVALTATATIKSRETIIESLGMVTPYIISFLPDKPNMVYHVKLKTTLDNAFNHILDQIRTNGVTTPKVIIFCRTYDHCSLLYRFFKHSLRSHFTHPIGAADMSHNRCVDMFTHCTHQSVKDSIIASISNAESVLRILICTVAFGMGINSQGVRQVIHWGPSSDVESYIQETGRGGRDGLRCDAILYYKASELTAKITSPFMSEYCKNVTECCRKLLFKDFDGVGEPCDCGLCCDVCNPDCNSL